jgi:hypothetical protein
MPIIRFAALCLVLIAVSPSVIAADEPILKLIGRDDKIVELKASELAGLPRTEVAAQDRDGKAITYSGVELSTLLAKLDVPKGEKLRGEWLRTFVLVSAEDGYEAVFALPEFDDLFTNQKIILADQLNGKPLEAKAAPFQIIVPNEKRHARWVRMVKEIRIVDSRKAKS